MKKRTTTLLMAMCLTLVLAIPVCAVENPPNTFNNTFSDSTSEITPEFLAMFGPDNPLHPYFIPTRWSSESGSTHQFITQNAITIVKNSYPSYPLNAYTSTLKNYSDYPDREDSGQTDGGLFYGHFYNPDTGLSFRDEMAIRPKTDPTAKDRLIWWYNHAVSEYNAGRIDSAMTALGCALHYTGDLSTPHHAANRVAILSLHLEFENFARVSQSDYTVTSAQSNTFSWARNTNIGDMGHNFAENAKDQILNAEDLDKFDDALSATLPKAQKNCAAVLYKFLVDVDELN